MAGNVRDPDAKAREDAAREAAAKGDAGAPLVLSPGVAQGIQGAAQGTNVQLQGATPPNEAALAATPNAEPGIVGGAQRRAAEETASAPVTPYSSDAERANFNARFGGQPPPGQVVMTPGGWRPKSVVQEEQVKGWQPGERTRGLYDVADTLQAQGMQGQSDVELGASIARQGVLSKVEQGSQEYLQGAKKRSEMQEKIKANRIAQIQQMGKEIDEFKFDRRRLFHNMNAGDVAVFAAGSLFGALGEAFSAAAGHPGQNAFLQNLNRSVERDLNLQERDLAKKERGETRAVNALDALAQQMGDFNAARDALYIGQLKVYENELAKLAEQWKNTARGPQYQLAMAQIVRERAAREQAFDAAQQASITKQMTNEYHPPNAVVVGGPSTKGPGEGQKYRDAQVKDVVDYVTKQKVPEKESIMRDFLAGIPAAKQSAVLTALRGGDLGNIRGVIADAFGGDQNASSRFYNGLDKLMRERTGAAIRPEERGYYEHNVLGTSGDARFQGTIGLLRSFDEDIQNTWDYAGSSWGDAAFEAHDRLNYLRGRPHQQTIPSKVEQVGK